MSFTLLWPWGEREVLAYLSDMPHRSTRWAILADDGSVTDADGARFASDFDWRRHLWHELQAPPHNMSPTLAADAVGLPLSRLREVER